MFNYYKKEFKELNKKFGFLRFITIEYICGLDGVDPYEMAAALSEEGIKILYDDSSISKEKNEKKERRVNKLIS